MSSEELRRPAANEQGQLIRINPPLTAKPDAAWPSSPITQNQSAFLISSDQTSPSSRISKQVASCSAILI
jgi:hypothetical protein